MKTRNGIFYDLNKSDISFTVNDTGLTFVFSSKLYKRKFKEKYIQHRKTFNLKMQARYQIYTEFKTFPDIDLYRRIEKRGFLLPGIAGGEEIWQDNLKLHGEIATLKN